MSNQPSNKQVSIMALACVTVIAVTMMVLTAMMNVANAQGDSLYVATAQGDSLRVKNDKVKSLLKALSEYGAPDVDSLSVVEPAAAPFFPYR